MPLQLAPLVDQGSLMASARDLVPNLLEQNVRSSLAASQAQQAQTGANQEARLLQDAEREQRTEEAFQSDLEAVVLNPTAQGYSRLMTVYPDKAEALKKGWNTFDEDKRSRDLSEMSQIFAAGANDAWDLVEKRLQARVDADREAGDLDDADDEMLEMVKSGDPVERRRVLGLVGYHLSTIGGVERYAPILEKLKPVMEGEPAEKYARSLGMKPGTPEYNSAVQDYILRGQGPTAYDNREQFEGVQQGYRERLEGVRQGGRVALEGVRQGNRVALEGVKESGRRTRPAPDKPPSPSSVIGKIMAKQAAGQPLTTGEQRVWVEYQSRGRKNSGKGRAGSGGGNGAIIVNPQTGKRLQLQGGKWVPVR